MKLTAPVPKPPARVMAPAEKFIDAKAPYSLVFGNEATGLPDSFANTCQPVILRQSSQVDSLNLSIAASIAMYLFKQ